MAPTPSEELKYLKSLVDQLNERIKSLEEKAKSAVLPTKTTMKPKVIVTGASGVLGTAVYNAFNADGYIMLGLANSRATKELVQLDLLDFFFVNRIFNEFKPDCELTLLRRVYERI